MITIGYSTRTHNPQFIEYLKKSCGIPDVKIIEKVNNGQKSLTKVYNEILDESQTDIVVLCHDDIYFETRKWAAKLEKHFSNSDYGILGVAGTTYLSTSGRWWDVTTEMKGTVNHEHEGKKWTSKYSIYETNEITPTIIVDGLFIGVHKNRIKKNFNESFDGFHFYDISFCFDNFIEKVSVGVVPDILITHKSVGMTNESWESNKVFFAEKYKEYLPQILEEKLPTLPKRNAKQPLVSIVIPIYNYGLVLNRTLASVFESSYKNIEIIIVDDGSTNDYVLMKLEKLKTHPNITVIHQTNSGPSSARNTGIKHSTGEFILPLDADDMIKPDYIRSCVSVLNNNKNVSPVYCDTIHIGEIQGIEKRPNWSMEELKKRPFIVNCSMFSRKSYDDVGGYDETLVGWEDYDFWIRMGLQGYIGKYIPKPMFIYFHHEKDGTVSTKANLSQQELKDRIMKKNKLY